MGKTLNETMALAENAIKRKDMPRIAVTPAAFSKVCAFMVVLEGRLEALENEVKSLRVESSNLRRNNP